MNIVRTPNIRFENLPDFPYGAHYVDVDDLRVHYIDAGKGDPILCLHGEPTWSFLYRKMIPVLSQHNRVIAMDFVGFGRSDKFVDRDSYTFEMHARTLKGFIETLNLDHITMVVQDWGGLIGLPVAIQMPERIARLVIMNTALPTGEEPMSDAYMRWQQFAARTPDMSIGRVVANGMAHPENISPEVIAGYEAPFPDVSYKAGASIFPALVPVTTDNPAAPAMKQAREALSKWDKPVLVMFSDGDPITRSGDTFFRNLIPTANDQPEITITDAGHFLQEEKGEEIAQHIVDFITRTPEQNSQSQSTGQTI